MRQTLLIALIVMAAYAAIGQDRNVRTEEGLPEIKMHGNDVWFITPCVKDSAVCAEKQCYDVQTTVSKLYIAHLADRNVLAGIPDDEKTVLLQDMYVHGGKTSFAIPGHITKYVGRGYFSIGTSYKNLSLDPATGYIQASYSSTEARTMGYGCIVWLWISLALLWFSIGCCWYKQEADLLIRPFSVVGMITQVIGMFIYMTHFAPNDAYTNTSEQTPLIVISLLLGFVFMIYGFIVKDKNDRGKFSGRQEMLFMNRLPIGMTFACLLSVFYALTGSGVEILGSIIATLIVLGSTALIVKVIIPSIDKLLLWKNKRKATN